MTRLTAFSTLAALTLTSLPAAADTLAGYTTTMMPVEHRSRDVELHLWYPTTTTTTTTTTQEPSTLGSNAVFHGVEVAKGATPRSGALPLVLLSHGSGGNAANLAWIATELANRGMVVAAPNHPGTTSRDSLQAETIKIWERPADLSAIVDLGLSGGFDGITIDAEAIAAVGFSLGGYTVLGTAGAQVSKAAYIDYCDANAGLMDCGWLAEGGVDLATIDQTRYEQSNLDPRINAVVAIDPALSAAYTPGSLEKMQIPVQLINLGEPADMPAAIDAAPLLAPLPYATLHNVAQAEHFSFLGLCKWMAPALLRAIGEDPICSEPGDRSRDSIHTELRTTIGGFLTSVFAKRP